MPGEDRQFPLNSSEFSSPFDAHSLNVYGMEPQEGVLGSGLQFSPTEEQFIRSRFEAALGRDPLLFYQLIERLAGGGFPEGSGDDFAFGVGPNKDGLLDLYRILSDPSSNERFSFATRGGLEGAMEMAKRRLP